MILLISKQIYMFFFLLFVLIFFAQQRSTNVINVPLENYKQNQLLPTLSDSEITTRMLICLTLCEKPLLP